MNEKALKELSLRDRDYMNELLAKEIGGITPAERIHLVSRRDYLTKETRERFEIEGAEDIADDNGDDTGNTGGGTDNEYETMTVAELKKMCEDRNIEIDSKAKKADLVEILVADDNGELEDEEEDEE